MSGKNGNHAPPTPSTYRVEVACKPGYSDPAGVSVATQFAQLGLMAPLEVKVGSLYEIVGRYSARELEQAAKELFADPVTQEFRVGDGPISPAFLVAPHWRIEVWLKASVSDPMEASVKKGLTDIGLSTPARVRCGKVYKIVGRLPAAQIEKAARKLLSNPVVHKYTIATP